jgi:8-oxo-dGTP pyrophosphatase MutT (NUDIX family)
MNSKKDVLYKNNNSAQNDNDFGFFQVSNKSDYGWIVNSLPAVVIVPVQIDERSSPSEAKNKTTIGLIQIFRKPIEKMGWELPGGSLDEMEKPWQTTKRELYEETGMETHEIEEIGQFYEAPGRMVFPHFVFIAKNPKHSVYHDELLQKKENIRQFQFFSLEKVNNMIEQGDIISGPTLAGLGFLKQWLSKFS